MVLIKWKRYVAASMVATSFAWPVLGRADAPVGRYVSQNGTVFDTETGLTWQRTDTSNTYEWAAAQSYCSSLNLQGGGWRLPNMKEIQTLVDESQLSLTGESPCIDPIFLSEPGPDLWTWTSTPSAAPCPPPPFQPGGCDMKWRHVCGTTGLEYGSVVNGGVSVLSRVRCVR
jgi:hypothetical protein